MTTIAERIAERNRVWINCGVSNHSHEIDLEQLAGRLGADHGAMHDDLTPKFTCRRCADRGERRRDIFMTVSGLWPDCRKAQQLVGTAGQLSCSTQRRLSWQVGSCAITSGHIRAGDDPHAIRNHGYTNGGSIHALTFGCLAIDHSAGRASQFVAFAGTRHYEGVLRRLSFIPPGAFRDRRSR